MVPSFTALGPANEMHDASGVSLHTCRCALRLAFIRGWHLGFQAPYCEACSRNFSSARQKSAAGAIALAMGTPIFRAWQPTLVRKFFMAKLDGKIVLISGGTSGIGAETAKLFQSEGATVVVTGSSERSVEAAKAALPGIEVLFSDAGNVAATKILVDQVKIKHGRIDVLFVNAGIAKFAPIALVDEAFYDSQFNLNVKGAFFLVKHAIPVIPDGGAIILTASVAGANGGLGGSTIYGSTKAALRSFGRTIAKELTPRGIRVNTISPGPIITPILDKGGLTPAQKDNFIEGAKTRIPLGRTGTAAEVAAAALYLAADATYTTGAELFVDGGLIDL
jgi:NAD(P)-dependent dehydrogenase (short-subunit alcohol dehydrogenase family)